MSDEADKATSPDHATNQRRCMWACKGPLPEDRARWVVADFKAFCSERCARDWTRRRAAASHSDGGTPETYWG